MTNTIRVCGNQRFIIYMSFIRLEARNKANRSILSEKTQACSAGVKITLPLSSGQNTTENKQLYSVIFISLFITERCTLLIKNLMDLSFLEKNMSH